jgi:hypothetical protein
MMKRPRLKIALALGSLALLAALAPAPQEVAKVTVNVGQLKELAEARAKVCQRMVDYYRDTLKAPPKPNRDPDDWYAASYEPIEIWSRRLLDARLDSAASPDERITLLAAEVERIAKFAGEIRGIAEANPGLKVIADQVDFMRLEVEFRLAKEKAAR